ncbi:hypothetical protein CPB86DRAFT_408351 [Serendipita vermifera]|nr:hypothetical protein CPB86DRAFT_408351 [Serendipita vermifera]
MQLQARPIVSTTLVAVQHSRTTCRHHAVVKPVNCQHHPDSVHHPHTYCRYHPVVKSVNHQHHPGLHSSSTYILQTPASGKSRSIMGTTLHSVHHLRTICKHHPVISTTLYTVHYLRTICKHNPIVNRWTPTPTCTPLTVHIPSMGPPSYT